MKNMKDGIVKMLSRIESRSALVAKIGSEPSREIGNVLTWQRFLLVAKFELHKGRFDVRLISATSEESEASVSCDRLGEWADRAKAWLSQL